MENKVFFSPLIIIDKKIIDTSQHSTNFFSSLAIRIYRFEN